MDYPEEYDLLECLEEEMGVDGSTIERRSAPFKYYLPVLGQVDYY